MNERFSIRVKPLPGEALSSFLLRLKSDNGLQVLRIVNSFWDKPGCIQSSDLPSVDIFPESFLNLQDLSNAVGCSADSLNETTFLQIQKIFSISGDVENARFLSGMFAMHSRFCPACLEEKAYHRLFWRIESIKACPIHNCKIMDTCICGKKISLESLFIPGMCPSCQSLLSRAPILQANEEEIKKSKWQVSAWNSLHKWQSIITPSELAMRLLFIIGKKQPCFDRRIISSVIKNRTLLATLLQHARGSLYQKRTIHLSFILKTLFSDGISMQEFLDLCVPPEFKSSIEDQKAPRVKRYACIAPWCDHYQIPGSLIKSGTNAKRTRDCMLYEYTFCNSCGCEYAFTTDNQITERTHFIKGYGHLLSQSKKMKSVRKAATHSKMSTEDIRRSLAYFHSRGLFTHLRVPYKINKSLLKSMINHINKGQTLKHIEKWIVWESYFHFLTHRYHIDVISALHKLKRPRPKYRFPASGQLAALKSILTGMLDRDESITTLAVSKMMGVVPETIRS